MNSTSDDGSRIVGPPPGPGDVVLALAGVLLLWAPVLALHLTPALFAALVTYGGTRAIARVLLRRRASWPHAQAWGFVVLMILFGGAGSIAIERAAEAAAQGGGYAGLMQQMAAALDQLRTMLPAGLASHVPVSLEALREALAGWLRSHSAEVQLWGGHTVRGVGYTVAGVVIGALLALQLPLLPAEGVRSGIEAQPLVSGLRDGFDGLVASFTSVVFAQLRIAALNTALTALYLLVALPAMGTPLPMAGTLVAATFVASLIPVVGNLVSNSMIVIVSLTHSVTLAGVSLVWLIAIHKLEYFLNAQIVGSRIRASAWEILAAMLLLESLFGLAGLVSAPVIYAQSKSILRSRGWL